MRIAGGARAWWSRGGWRMRSSRPDLQTGKAPQTSTESVDPYAAASSSGTATAWSAERSPVGVMVRRPAKWGPPPETPLPSTRAGSIPGGVPRIERRSGAAALTGALDTAEGLRRAPGAPERRTLASIEHVGHPGRDATNTSKGTPTGLETSTNLHCCPVCVNTKEQSGRQCSGGLGGLPRGDRPARQSSTDAVQRIAESDRGLLGVSARCGRCDHRSRGFKRNSLSAALSRISVSGTSS